MPFAAQTTTSKPAALSSPVRPRCTTRGARACYRFASSPNVTGLTVGNITGINKKGWEYLWVRYADAEDAAAKALVKKPIAAYIEQVYPYGDLNALGI